MPSNPLARWGRVYLKILAIGGHKSCVVLPWDNLQGKLTKKKKKIG